MTTTASLIVIGLALILIQYSCIANGHRERRCRGAYHRRLVKDPEDCTKYKFCIRGEYRSRQCPPGRIFNQRRQRCMSGDSSDCSNQGRCAALDDGIYRATTDCSRHFKCENNKEVLGERCKDGTLYDLTKNMCLFPDLVSCPVPKHQDLCTGKEDGYHQHPYYCNRYFYCISGYIAQSDKCDYGLLFDNTLKECKEATTVFCPPVYGGWTEWRLSRCSARCGKGFIRRYRTCTNPKPKNNGKNCLGRSSSIIPCEKDSCKDYRKTCAEGTLTERRFCYCPSHTLNGKVEDDSGNPIAGAKIYRKVKRSQELATSLADGSFTISGVCANENEVLDAKRDFYLEGSGTAENTSPTESTVTITMQKTVPLSFTAQPQDTLVYEGVTVVLKCNADGKPLPTYEWYKNGALVQSQSTASTESTYTIQSPQSDDAGLYRCKAINSLGSLYSNEADVRVYDSSSTDTCDSTPKPSVTQLPIGCVTETDNQPFLDFGSCSNDPCLSTTTSSNEQITCCRPATFQSVNIRCDLNVIQTSVVTSCSCQVCQEKTTVIYGIIKELGTEQAVSNVAVKVDGVEIEAAVTSNGQFRASIPTSRGRSVISLVSNDDTFETSVKVVEFNQQDFVFVKLYVAKPSFSMTFSHDQETNIPLHPSNDAASSFGTVTIAANSLMLPDGTSYQGTVTVTMTVIDPRVDSRQPYSISASVGDFTTIDEDGLEQTLQSSGMFAMSFKADNGQRLRLTKPASVSISTDEVNVEDGSNIYYMDKSTGRWIKISALTRQDPPAPTGRRRRSTGVFYIGTFTEPLYDFSGFYNIDKPWRMCYVSVRVRDPSSNANVAGSLVSMIGKAGQANYGFNQAVTGANGACVKTICKAGGWLTSEHEGQLLFPGALPTGTHNGQPTQIEQNLFVGFGSHVMPSPAETAQFINDAQMSAILGPVYTESQESDCKTPAANSLSFEFLKPPVVNPNIILGEIVNQNHYERLSWHSDGSFPTHCAVKVVVIGKPTPIVVKSYTHDKSQEYGTRIVSAQQDPSDPTMFSACVPYKCTETIYDGVTLVTPIDTLVKVAPSASECTFKEISQGFLNVLNNNIVNNADPFSYEFKAPELTSSDSTTGLYFNQPFGSIGYDRRQNLANCREGLDAGGDIASNLVYSLKPAIVFDCESGGSGVGVLRPLK